MLQMQTRPALPTECHEMCAERGGGRGGDEEQALFTRKSITEEEPVNALGEGGP